MDRLNIGLTGKQQVIHGVAVRAGKESLPKVILLGGLDADRESQRFVEAVIERHEHRPVPKRRFHLLAVPMANPDGARLIFPPTGVAYRDHPESQYLWNWIALQGADLVLIAGEQDFGLSRARLLPLKTSAFDVITRSVETSAARLEEELRLQRSPREIADALAKIYGHDFDPPLYIPAMALIGRLRLGELEDLEKLAAPYLDGTKNSMDHPTPSHLAGHLLFAELGRRTHNPGYARLVEDAASRALELHDQMSDAVFMGCPILAAAGHYDQSLQHLRNMQRLCLRSDGLYRHSPLNDAAWGRGNAFPALGLAMSLSYMPQDHAAFAEMRRDFQKHLALLMTYQNEDGMWREVIDQVGVYGEFSATAMILTAVARGVRMGWLDAKTYEPHIRSAWRGLVLRIGANGEVADTCESTGKQKSAEDYLFRAALQVRDPRGGGMALLAATELCCAGGKAR